MLSNKEFMVGQIKVNTDGEWNSDIVLSSPELYITYY